MLILIFLENNSVFCFGSFSDWYHAEAVELEESKIFDLAGFKCCRCRRIRSPVCPYLNPDSKKQLEEKQIRTRAIKQDEKDPHLEIVPQEVKMEPATTVLPVGEQVVYVAEDDPLLFNYTKVEQFTEQNTDVGYEWNATTVSASGPQKLPVRRHNKREKEVDCSLAGNSSHDNLSTFGGDILNSADESLSHVEWDLTASGFDDGLMFNYEDLTCEDMEFEPQTYFSFNELLASDDGDQDVVGSSENTAENWENSSLLPSEVVGDASFSQREPTCLVEHADNVVPCRMCSHSEPCPELCCQVCGLCIHSHCSPWIEQSFGDGGWRCGNCREWR